MTHAFSSGNVESVDGCMYCQGRLVEELMRWTDRLVTKLDPTGMVDTPFDDQTRSATVGPASVWRSVPRIRPVQLHGGYGLVARITF